MLKTLREFEEGQALTLLLKGVEAYDPETGAYLRASHGRSHYAPKWFLFFADEKDANGDYRPYREWRTIFRAWSSAEALAIANEKLATLMAKGQVGISEGNRKI